MTFRTFSGAFAAAVILLAWLAVPRAQQPPQAPQQPQQQQPQQQRPEGRMGQPPAGAPSTQAKPFVPLAASTLAAHPETYYGETVTVTAAVERAARSHPRGRRQREIYRLSRGGPRFLDRNLQ